MTKSTSKPSTRRSCQRLFACDLGAAIIAALALGIAVWVSDPGRWEAAASQVSALLSRARIYFSSATQNSSEAVMFYPALAMAFFALRSEEHTSELQSR